MRGKQLFVVPLLLVSLAGCPGGPKATSVSPGPLQSSPSATPSITPTTQKPVVTPSPQSATTPTAPTTPACPKSPWNTNEQTKAFDQIPKGSAVQAAVTWEKCYDRFTVTLSGTTQPGYHAEYVDVPRTDPRGEVIRMKGKAFLMLSVRALESPRPTVKPDVGRMIQEARYAGASEKYTLFAIGLDQKRPFAVRVYPGTTKNTVRVIVSVARQ